MLFLQALAGVAMGACVITATMTVLERRRRRHP